MNSGGESVERSLCKFAVFCGCFTRPYAGISSMHSPSTWYENRLFILNFKIRRGINRSIERITRNSVDLFRNHEHYSVDIFKFDIVSLESAWFLYLSGDSVILQCEVVLEWGAFNFQNSTNILFRTTSNKLKTAADLAYYRKICKQFLQTIRKKIRPLGKLKVLYYFLRNLSFSQ